jgi:hypothetical protein
MHMNIVRFLGKFAPFALFAVVALFACGDDDPAGTEEPDLAGTYQLVSIAFQGQPALMPPVASGTFTLTATTYEVDISIDLPPPNNQTIQDEGTYSINGTGWSQESSQGGVQSVGTFTFDGTRLEVNATTQGQTVATVWNKV